MPRKDFKSNQQMPLVKLRDGSVVEFRRSQSERTTPEMLFSEMVRQSIKESGVSQYALAKVAGVPQQVINDFVSGKNPRLQAFSRIAHWMGFEIRQNREKAPQKHPPT